MNIILGATGHIGSILSEKIKAGGKKLIVVTHDAHKVKDLTQQGYTVEVVDIYNSLALSKVLDMGQRAFIINPPANPITDTDTEELKTVHSIVEAVKNSSIKKLVVASTYGAQNIQRAGDLGVLYELEQQLQQLQKPVSIIRSAYYMSNWDGALQTIEKESAIYSFFEEDLEIPMIAPTDIATLAAKLLAQPIDHTETHFLEAPEKYSSQDVAKAFSNALNKAIKVITIPENKWIDHYQKIGFSTEAAESYAQMTKIVAKENYEKPNHPTLGCTTLEQYVAELVKNS